MFVFYCIVVFVYLCCLYYVLYYVSVCIDYFFSLVMHDAALSLMWDIIWGFFCFALLRTVELFLGGNHVALAMLESDFLQC